VEDCISLTLNNFTAVNAVRGRKNKVVVKRASFKYCSSNIDVFTNESRSNNLRFVSKALRKQFSKNIYSFRIINKIQCVGWPATYRSTRANQMISSFHLFHTASNDYIILSLWICCKRTLLSWHCCHDTVVMRTRDPIADLALVFAVCFIRNIPGFINIYCNFWSFWSDTKPNRARTNQTLHSLHSACRWIYNCCLLLLPLVADCKRGDFSMVAYICPKTW